jgi:cytochrome c biogenesis protein CcmG, thiol:disulfide interchange protein DsbE
VNWKRSAVGAGIALPIIGLLMFGLSRDPRAMDSTLPGRPAPAFALATLDGAPADTIRLADHAGEVVVLNFWASWCLQCRTEHSTLSELATSYNQTGVKFYGVLWRDSPEKGRAWIEEMGGQSYPSIIDIGNRTGMDYGLYGVPETIVIGRDGRVAQKLIGPVCPDRSAGCMIPTDSLRALIDAELSKPAVSRAGAGSQ